MANYLVVVWTQLCDRCPFPQSLAALLEIGRNHDFIYSISGKKCYTEVTPSDTFGDDTWVASRLECVTDADTGIPHSYVGLKITLESIAERS